MHSHPKQYEGVLQPQLFAEAESDTPAHAYPQYYRSEALHADERADQQAQLEDLLGYPDLRLAAIVRGWLLCQRGYPCFPVTFTGDPTRPAERARILLGGTALNGYMPAEFQRFARL